VGDQAGKADLFLPFGGAHETEIGWDMETVADLDGSSRESMQDSLLDQRYWTKRL